MAPILHCIRHAQGYHNLSREGEDCEQYPDPDLTKRGREQCERLRDDFPYHDQIDFIMASPIRRTIQTALIGLAPAIENKGLKILLTPRAQETSSKPSDTGSSLSKLKEEFGNKIDTRRMVNAWNSNEGEWSMNNECIERHIVELRHFIQGLDCEQAVLVAHGGVSFHVSDFSVEHFCSQTADYLPVHALLHRRLV